MLDCSYCSHKLCLAVGSGEQTKYPVQKVGSDQKSLGTTALDDEWESLAFEGTNTLLLFWHQTPGLVIFVSKAVLSVHGIGCVHVRTTTPWLTTFTTTTITTTTTIPTWGLRPKSY